MSVFPRPLLQTKLQKPVLEAFFVERTRLYKNLAIEGNEQVNVIYAPLGYGKTVLAAQWLARTSLPSAWVSLDEFDNELSRFLTYVIAALQTVYPTACAETQKILNVVPSPPGITLFDSLIYEISKLQEIVLVLDDFHHIKNESIQGGMARLVRYKPANLKLVITTCADEKWITAAKLRQKVAETNRNDLSFTQDEASAWLACMGVTFRAEDVALLVERTEGWGLGLHITLMSLRHGSEFARLLDQAFTNSPHLLIGYFKDEVLRHQSVALRQFLLETSIFERFSIPLCQAIFEYPEEFNVQALIEQAESVGLPIIRLDQQGDWFRYHSIFREVLQHELQASYPRAKVQALHMRACQWWQKEGYLEEAFRHALAAEKPEEAVKLLDNNLHDLLNHQEYVRLGRWLDYFPQAFIARQPALLIAQGYLYYYQNYLPAIPNLLSQVHTLLDQAPASLSKTEIEILRGDVDVLQSQIAFWNLAIEDARAAGERALQHLPLAHSYARGTVLAMIIASYAVRGEISKAFTLVNKELNHTDPQDGSMMTQLIYAKGIVSILSGSYLALKAQRDKLLQNVILSSGGLYVGRGHYALGMIHYELNELDMALASWAELLSLKYSTSHFVYFQGLLGLALTNQALGLSSDADYFADMAFDFAQELNQDEMYLDAKSFQARLALLRSNKVESDELFALLEGTYPVPYDFFKISVQVSVITYIWMLIRQNTAASLNQAEALLQTCFEITHSFYNVPITIKLLALQALTFAAQKKASAAETSLLRAIELAKPRRFIRTFVDLGAEMKALLLQLSNKGFARAFILPIIEHFNDSAALQGSLPASGKNIPHIHLTHRELEVLRFLAKRYTDKEIAARLFISSQTVRRHAANIYAKFGVKNRREAVLLAHELHILTPT